MTRRISYSAVMLGSVLILSGTGAWISGHLVKEHAGPWPSDRSQAGLFARVCEATAGAGLGCEGAIRGPWATFKIPVPVPAPDLTVGVHTVIMPVAFLSLAYFVFMTVWFAFIGRPRVYGRGWHRIPLGVGLCGAAVSLFYLGLMALGVAPWCVWCLAVHAVNLLMVFAIWRLGAGRRFPEFEPDIAASDQTPKQIARATITAREAVTAVAFSLILIAGLWAYRREHLVLRNGLRNLLPYKAVVTSLQEDPEFLLRTYHAQPQQDIPVRSRESSESSQPRLTVFTDFECPACYCNSLSIRHNNAEVFKGKLAVTIRHYPLDSKCNANVETELHPNACESAYAAEAARLQGGDEAFERMHALLFESRKALGHDLYLDLAGRLGLDIARFQADMEGEVVRRIVQSDIKLAEKLGVTGTPTMLLNGRHIPKLCLVPVFWEAIADRWRIDLDDGSQATVESIAGPIPEAEN